MPKALTRKNTGLVANMPIKIIQFGEGVFLRAFADFIIDKLNKQENYQAGMVVVKPRAGNLDALNAQDGLYNLFLRGFKDGALIDEHHLVSCIQKGISPHSNYQEFLDLAHLETLEILISNTTEAGIAFNEKDTFKGYPHQSFPAKVTAFLFERFTYFKENPERGLVIIPCELIEDNADALKELILKYADLWELPDAFKNWIINHNHFHNTLVDRIVPGYPKDDIDSYQEQLEFEDRLIVSAEAYLLWAIQGDKKLLEIIPFDKLDENILVVDDLKPYRLQKVRILNGAHTVMVPISLLYGNETVTQSMDNVFTGAFVREAVFTEITQALPIPEEQTRAFAEAVFDRFRNPFIKHQLASIALNSISKFKVRVLPSLLEYQQKKGKLPVHLTFAFACLILFYKGIVKGKPLPLNDSPEVIDFFKNAWQQINSSQTSNMVLSNTHLWDQDLTQIPELQKRIAEALSLIDEKGVEAAFITFLAKF